MGISEFAYQQMVARLEKNSSREPIAPDAVSDEIEGLHYPIIAWCREHGAPYIRARSDKESTIGLGAPDFTILFGGKVHFIECKSRTGQLTPEQIAWRLKAEAQGITVHVIRSMSEFSVIVNGK